MQYALLGQLQFELLAYFNGLEGRIGTDYAEHARIEGKPRLQRIGDKLDEWTIKLKFHDTYCDPEQELAGLKQAAGTHAALPFVLANGEYKGDFVITDISLAAEHTDTAGRLIAVEASISLKEFIQDNSADNMASQLAAPAIAMAGKHLPPELQKLPASGQLGAVRIALSQAARHARAAVAACRTATSFIAAARQLQSNPLAAIERLGRAAPALGTLASSASALGSSLAPLAGRLASTVPLISSAGRIAAEATAASQLLSGLSTGNVIDRTAQLSGLMASTAGQLANAGSNLTQQAARTTLRGGE